MVTNLWVSNHPRSFWRCPAEPPEELWQAAIERALPSLGFGQSPGDIATALALAIGEGRFGPRHWKLGAGLQLYYLLKPALPRVITRTIRSASGRSKSRKPIENWPIDPRYPSFQLEVLRQVLLLTGTNSIRYTSLWPDGTRFAFVLTHDVETGGGQAFVREVAALEEALGFRSSFNFVLERYPLDLELIGELRQRGFEVGCHGLKHDGLMFRSRKEFLSRAAILNTRMRELGIVGFRSPLTHRNPEWMQALDIEYDGSFFDTDPFEPIPGGAMTIWPYFIGRFVELPYTLVQDHTLISVLGASTPQCWLQKVNFIEQNRGLALLISHPDYLRDKTTWNCYAQFLSSMAGRDGFWWALPREAARWWKRRAGREPGTTADARHYSVAHLDHERLVLS